MPTVLLNLLLTILAEFPVHILGFHRRPPLQVMLVCVLLNGLTQPLATWLYFSLEVDYWALEGGIALVEGLILALIWEMPSVGRRILWGMLVSVVANAASIGLGEWVWE